MITIPLKITCEISPWVEALSGSGTIMCEEGGEINCLKENKTKRITIIMGKTDEDSLGKVIEKYESIFDDPTLSVRYFVLLANISEQPTIQHDRLRCIRYMSIAPDDFVLKVHRSLYKARLPVFLRTGYEVEVTENLLKFQGEEYRSIFIHHNTYRCDNFYIHNKELYCFRGGKLKKLNEDSLIHVKMNRYSGGKTKKETYEGKIYLTKMKNTSESEE